MSLFRKTPEEAQDIHYKGNAVLRMLSYLKPHAGMMAVCLVLVLILTGLELYRPLITGNAIDLYIAGDYAPGEAVEERFRGLLLAAAQYGGALLVTFFCNNRMMNLLQK